MPPGRKAQTARTAETPTEAMALEYLRQRDQNIMRNDQVFESLGLGTLVAQVKGKSARNKDDVPEKSGSLYNPEDDEGSNQHDEDEVSMAAMEAMEAEPMQEGQQSMSSIEIVSKVLPRSSTFLQNVGLSTSKPSSKSAVSSQVWELQAQLEAKEQESMQLKQESTQLKQEVASQAHEIDDLKKGQQETNAFLRQLISFNQGQVTPL